MTAKAKKYTGARSFDGKHTRAMPENVAHWSMTMGEIEKLPIVVWNEEKQQWEYNQETN